MEKQHYTHLQKKNLTDLKKGATTLTKKFRDTTGQIYPKTIMTSDMLRQHYFVLDCGETKEEALKIRTEVMESPYFEQWLRTFQGKCKTKVENYTRRNNDNVLVPAVLIKFYPCNK